VNRKSYAHCSVNTYTSSAIDAFLELPNAVTFGVEWDERRIGVSGMYSSVIGRSRARMGVNGIPSCVCV
jgi:hypothetical protein